ncbi:hypothetical protein N7528_009971 [Penicillium herquei]|nr:hypothetical protein N7528_009971 [Penicillium herquei]
MMGTSLLTLPFDIIFAIVMNIGDRDFINLCRAHPKLSAHLSDEHLARKIVERTMVYSKEGQRAAAGEKDYPYRKAIEHRFYINEAFATAQPYSIDIIAYGSDKGLYLLERLYP